MSCEFDIIGLAFGSLEIEDRRLAEEHVAECAACRAELEEIRGVRDRIGTLPEVEPSADFVARIRRELPAAAPVRRAVWPGWSWSIALHAAVFAGLVLYFYYRMPLREPDVPSIVPLKGAERLAPEPPPAAELNLQWDKALKDDPFPAFMAARAEERQRWAHREMEGGARAIRTVEKGLTWLADHQDPDGGWGQGESRPAVTALAALALMAEGNGTRGPYSGRLLKATEFLISKQDGRGRVGSGHSIATVALVEAAILTGDSRVRQAAEAALAYLIGNRESESGWKALALRLSLYLNTRVGVPALAASVEPADGPARIRAAQLWAQVMATPAPAKGAFEEGRSLSREGPALERHLSALHFGSLIQYQLGDDAWHDWNFAMIDALVAAQADDGSWPADYDRDTPSGGAAYTTALCTLTLQTYYRYPRVLR